MDTVVINLTDLEDMGVTGNIEALRATLELLENHIGKGNVIEVQRQYSDGTHNVIETISNEIQLENFRQRFRKYI